MRMHICHHGYDFCKRQHFLELCAERPDILSRSIVEDRADLQNVFTAIKFSAYLFNIIWSQKVTPKQLRLLKLYTTGSKPVMREEFEQMNELNSGITPMSS